MTDWQKGRLKNGKNYEIDLENGFATFDLKKRDNVSDLMMLYLATHYFVKPKDCDFSFHVSLYSTGVLNCPRCGEKMEK